MAEDILSQPLADEVVIEDDFGNEITVGELRAFNTSVVQGGNSLPPPLRIGPVRYSLDGGDTVIEATLSVSDEGLLSLSRDVAAPIRIVDPADETEDPFDAMLALLQSGRTDDLLALLDDQIRVRQSDVSRLRRLLYVHQTALQNAVDIVQTKRIDFLEQKKDTWVDGAIGALFLAIVFTLFPVEAVIGEALLDLSKTAFRVLGERSLLRAFKANPGLSLSQKISELESNLKVLRSVAAPPGKGRVTSRKNLSAAQEAAFKSVRVRPGRDAKSLNLALDRTEGRLARRQAKRDRNEKRFRDRAVEDALPVQADFAKTGSSVLAKALENTAFNNAATLKEQVDRFAPAAKSSVLPSDGKPLDIALKEQVQGLYASLLFAGEDAIAALLKFRTACTTETPSDEHLEALAEILVVEDDEPEPSGADGSAARKIDITAADVQTLVNRGTEAYEQLIWILMYGNQLVRRAVGDSFLEGDNAFVGPPMPDPDHELLLNYLKGRFYPDMAPVDIGLAYETIFKIIAGRDSAAAASTLDFSCFADPQAVLKTIEDVRLHKVTLPRGQ